MVNASIQEASGSGRNEQYIWSCLFNLDANSSISGLKSRVSSIQYPEYGSKCLDSLSALTLREPGMCAAVSHVMSCEMLNSQICTASEWHSGLWHVPMLFIATTAVLLSIISLTCFPESEAWKYLRANRTAKSSRQLIWLLASVTDHLLPVEISFITAPIPQGRHQNTVLHQLGNGELD